MNTTHYRRLYCLPPSKLVFHLINQGNIATHLVQIMEDVLSPSIGKTGCHHIGGQLGLVGFAKLHDRLLCSNVLLEVRVRLPAAVVILCEGNLWVILSVIYIYMYI